MAIPSFLFGGDTGDTQESLKRKRAVAQALLVKAANAPKNVGEGLSAIGNALIYRSLAGKLDASDLAGQKAADTDAAALFTGADNSAPASIGTPDAAKELAATDPKPDVSANGSTFEPFISTIQAGDPASNIPGLTNPNALAAVASTGKSESGWSEKNAGRTWSDPSQSGKPGMAGGVMSWRGPRLQALQTFASKRGEQGNGSPQTQALFFLQEDPQLVAKLNAAESPEEAQRLMNNAWAFAGFDRPGGETARRIGQASAYLPRFEGQGNRQVASLDPSAGAPSAAAAIEAQAPSSGYVDPTISAPNSQPQQAMPMPAGNQPTPFDAGRFGDPIKLSEMPASGEELPANLSAQANAYAPAQQMPTGTAPSPQVVAALANQPASLPPLPSADIGPAPVVAGAPPGQDVAQALLSKGQPVGSFPPPPEPASSGPSTAALMKVLNNPYSSDGAKAYAQALLKQKIDNNDPDTVMTREFNRAKLNELKNPKPKYDYTTLPDGTVLRTNSLGGAPEKVYESAPKATPTQQEYEAYKADEVAAGRKPLGRLQYEQEIKKAGASQTTNIVGGEGDNFYKELDKKNAETFSTLSQAGIEARSKLGQIDRLDALMANAPQGAVGALKQAAGEWGIATEGLGDIQAATALLERMVPQQRLPGSGTMSDGDIKMFRSSLPKIINQPGGNQLIMQSLRGIAQYEQQMGDISDRVANREMKEDGKVYGPADARRDIAALRNPLADFKVPTGGTPNQGLPKPTTSEEFDALKPGDYYIDPDDGKTYRK